MSFYESKVSNALRFGDVVSGFVIATPHLKAPMSGGSIEPFGIEIHRVGLSVILSPCCSISDQTISVAPLIQVRSTFYKNEYLADDLTRINRQLEPQYALPEAAWKNMEDDERNRRLASGLAYMFVELFVYESHALFPPYVVHRKEGSFTTNAYMIDFRDAQKINCDEVVTPSKSPLGSKLLELSVASRADLRDKIAFYYSRIPDEDRLAVS